LIQTYDVLPAHITLDEIINSEKINYETINWRKVIGENYLEKIIGKFYKESQADLRYQ